MNRFAAECCGTFCLVFAGTGAIVINDVSGGAVTHVGVSLTFGLIVMAMICALDGVSGAHLNPAVTLGFCLARKFSFGDMPLYWTAQACGACCASVCLRFLFPAHETLGLTAPAGPPWQAFAVETMLTALLMFVILCVPGAQGRLKASLAVGGVIALEALFAGPLTGASMNPARSFAPALVSGHFENVWIYLVAPPLGAALAVPCYRWAYPRGVPAEPTWQP